MPKKSKKKKILKKYTGKAERMRKAASREAKPQFEMYGTLSSEVDWPWDEIWYKVGVAA